jgi:hypothetical protein
MVWPTGCPLPIIIFAICERYHTINQPKKIYLWDAKVGFSGAQELCFVD